MPCTHEIRREGITSILHLRCEDVLPSIEDSPLVMSTVVKLLAEQEDVQRILITTGRDYEYDEEQTSLLKDIARAYKRLTNEKSLLSLHDVPRANEQWHRQWLMRIRDLIYNMLPSDPIGAYVEAVRERRHALILREGVETPTEQGMLDAYLSHLNHLITILEGMRIIRLAQDKLAGYQPGTRDVYRTIFKPIVKPEFMYAKLLAAYPQDGEEIDAYTLRDGTEVTIFRVRNDVRLLYHIIPPEFKLDEEKYTLLYEAKKIIAEYKPRRQDFIEPERVRSVFKSISHDLISELADMHGILLTPEELDLLSSILVRYTIGFGLLEVILSDEQIQDVTLNSPEGLSPIYLVHAVHGECRTNIIPTRVETESWAGKLRLLSGRPLDEANPVLDMELTLPGAKARVAVVGEPLNPHGLAFAFRRHRDKPWTLPLFIKQRMLTPLAAGLLSFLVDGARTFLIAGTRSAGKTSLLASLMLEIMRRYRIITVEDTLELPVQSLVKLGYNIQPLKVAAALSRGVNELEAEAGIRTSLRLGDSALIVGEVRSTEARALYEAMRVGALANVVAGTIHGDSPYGVYDRVVNDLGVPKTSFKATDILIIAKPVKSADGLHKWRRVVRITEVRKHWEDDPLLENGFVDLFVYNAERDMLEPTPELIQGESEVVKAVAETVRDWAGNWEAVWENILLRADVKERLVSIAEEKQMPSLLEAEFVVRANDAFHMITEKVREEKGRLERKEIFHHWEAWLEHAVKAYARELRLRGNPA